MQEGKNSNDCSYVMNDQNLKHGFLERWEEYVLDCIRYALNLKVIKIVVLGLPNVNNEIDFNYHEGLRLPLKPTLENQFS